VQPQSPRRRHHAEWLDGLDAESSEKELEEMKWERDSDNVPKLLVGAAVGIFYPPLVGLHYWNWFAAPGLGLIELGYGQALIGLLIFRALIADPCVARKDKNLAALTFGHGTLLALAHFAGWCAT
jgi:hypothetical protein